MKTFGQFIRKARKSAGLTQKEVAERLRRGDGRKVLPPFVNDLEFDRRRPPEDAVIEQLAEILKVPSDILYFYAQRVAEDVRVDAEDGRIAAAYRAFRKILNGGADIACERSSQSRLVRRSRDNGTGRLAMGEP